jgi:hypothetical protein
MYARLLDKSILIDVTLMVTPLYLLGFRAPCQMLQSMALDALDD